MNDRQVAGKVRTIDADIQVDIMDDGQDEDAVLTATYKRTAKQTKMQVKGHPCDPCLFENETTQASGFCRVCLEYLCEDCVRNHKKNKFTREHTLLNGGDIPENVKALQILAGVLACPDHPDKEVESFCGDHQKYVCIECLGKAHRKCERVDDIAELLNPLCDKAYIEESYDKLKSLRELSIAARKAKVNDIEYMLKEQDYIKEGKCCFAKVFYEMLIEDDGRSQETINKIMTEQMANLTLDIAELEALERDRSIALELVGAALNHGTEKQVRIVGFYMKSQIRSFLLKVDANDIGRAPGFETVANEPRTFENVACQTNTTQSSQQTEVIERVKESKAEETPLVKEDGIKDNVVEQGTEPEPKHEDLTSSESATEDNKLIQEPCHQPLMSRNIGNASKYNISVTKDKYICSVIGIVKLPDGRFIVLDDANGKIKVYNERLEFIFLSRLEFDPSDICNFESDSVAVTFGYNRSVAGYSINKSDIRCLGSFTTDMHCYCISKYHSNLAILVQGGSECEIQIRQPFGGSILKIITNFKDGSCPLKIDPCSLKYSTTHGFLIGERGHILRCFGVNGKQFWFYQGERKSRIRCVISITEDSEGNIYACGRNSNDVHQISGKNLWNNRVIAYLENANSVVIDEKNSRIVAGCENDNYLHVYPFV